MDVPDEIRPRAQSMTCISKPQEVPKATRSDILAASKSEADMLSSSLPIPSFFDYFRFPSKSSSLGGSTESGFMSDDEGISVNSAPNRKNDTHGITITVPQIKPLKYNHNKPHSEQSLKNSNPLLPSSFIDFFKQKHHPEGSVGLKTASAKTVDQSGSRPVRVNRRDLNSFAPTSL